MDLQKVGDRIELISKGYPINKKMTLKTKAESGTAVEVTLAQAKDNKFSAVFKPRYVCPLTGADLALTLDGSNVGQIELTKKGAIQGMKATVRLAPCDHTGAISVDYEHAKFSSTEEIEIKGGDLNVTSTIAFGNPERNAGVSVKVAGRELNEVAAGVATTKGKYSLNLFGKVGFQKSTMQYGVRAHYKACDSTNVAVEGTLAGTGMKLDAGSLDVKVAASYKVDASTSVQARIAKSGNLDVAVKMALNKNTNVTFGGSLDLAQQTFTANGLEVAFDL